VTVLLNKGADANAKVTDGRTALLFAIQNGAYTEVVKVLLARGADPNTKLSDGRTPLMLTADSPEIVTLLGSL